MPPRTACLCRRALLGLAALLAVAAGPDKPAEEVNVSVVAILATDKNADVDPKLKCIAEQMKQVDPKWTGFRIETMTCEAIKVGVKEKFNLVDGQTVTVTAERCAGKDKPVCLAVTAPTLGEITYKTCCGKFFPMVTGYKNKKGELLIVAVRVQTCKGGK
jgi:hypothetical protein